MRALVALFVVATFCLSASARADNIDQPGEMPARSTPGSHAGPRSIAFAYGRSDVPISAAAGDTRLVFVTQPLTRSVAVLDRFTGQQVGQLPAPPAGWLLPFSLRVPRNGHVVVLDSGGFPSPTTPRVYDYDFSYNAHTRQFTATLTRTVSFEGLPVVFAEDVEVTSSGAYVVSESIIGALWLIRPDGTIAYGLFPSTGVAIAQLAPCAFPGATVGGIPFDTAGHVAPGVVGLAERQGQLYFSTTCNGGVYRIPMASLSDPARDPAARAADIRTVSPRAPGVAESLHGLAFNRHNPGDRWLYAADSLQLRVVRIDTADGSRQVVAADPVLFNFPSKLQFLPPVAGRSPLVVASDQEHRLAAINAAITTDVVQPPWLVTKLLILGGAKKDDLRGAAGMLEAPVWSGLSEERRSVIK